MGKKGILAHARSLVIPFKFEEKINAFKGRAFIQKVFFLFSGKVRNFFILFPGILAKDGFALFTLGPPQSLLSPARDLGSHISWLQR